MHFKKYILFIFIAGFISITAKTGFSQMQVNAGKDTTYCVGLFTETLQLGSNLYIENGVEPYTVRWECKLEPSPGLIFTASDFLDDTTRLSPEIVDVIDNAQWLKFTVHVTDSDNNYAKDSINIRFSRFAYLTGYIVKQVEKGDSVLFNQSSIGGGIEPLSYHWQPTTGLTNPESLVTWCKTDSLTQWRNEYSVIATDSCGCVSAPNLVYEIRVSPNGNVPDIQKVVEPNKKWLYAIGQDYPTPEIDRHDCLMIADDTVISNKAYYKLYNLYNCDAENPYLRGFIRETEDAKIYFLSTNEEQEWLLYDFGLSVGDSMYFADEYYLYMDSVGYDNTNRKIFYFSNDIQWIEGIGSNYGLLMERIVGGLRIFTCCFRNEELLYHNPLFSSCFLNTQSFFNDDSFWSIVEDDFTVNKSHATDKALFQDSVVLAGAFVSEASCPHHSLFAYNLKGQKLWDIGGYFDLVYAASDYIYTAGYTPIDDVIGYEQIVVSKYDIAGNEIFSIGYPEVPHDFYFQFEPQSIDISTDGTILVSSKKSVIKSDINGTKIQEYQLTAMPDIKGIISMNPESYLIYSQNRIYKSDSSFVLSDSLQFSDSINKILLKNDTVYTLLDSSLVRLDFSLNVIDTLIETSTGFQDMEFYDENLWIRLNDQDIIKLVEVKNNSITDTLAFDLLSDVNGFIVANNNYTFIGTSFTDQIGLYNFHTTDLSGIELNLPDIELVDFDIDSISLEYSPVINEDSVLIGFRFNPELTVKNNGPDTIHTFSVFSDLYGGFNCAQNYFYQKFSGLEILPGQTQTVKLKRAYQEGINNNELCFETLAPNSRLEKQTENNALCKTFPITGIEDQVQPVLKVYPNPFSDYLIIENASSNMKNIELTDISGRALIHKAATDQRITIKTTGLKPGFYILKVNSDGKINTRLIIRE